MGSRKYGIEGRGPSYSERAYSPVENGVTSPQLQNFVLMVRSRFPYTVCRYEKKDARIKKTPCTTTRLGDDVVVSKGLTLVVASHWFHSAVSMHTIPLENK
jgi:hypothetical protein